MKEISLKLDEKVAADFAATCTRRGITLAEGFRRAMGLLMLADREESLNKGYKLGIVQEMPDGALEPKGRVTGY